MKGSTERSAGRLIAIDGADGRGVGDAAQTLQETLARQHITCAVSRWDASGLFTDVAAAPAEQRDLSPRTVVLLYAADLAFRLRWEITPALEQGQLIVAAPYITTAITFGLATGLSSEWLRTVFRFAPLPARTAILRERKGQPVWKRQTDRGFCECCTALLSATPNGFSRHKTRDRMVVALATSADKHGGHFQKRDVKELAKASFR